MFDGDWQSSIYYLWLMPLKGHLCTVCLLCYRCITFDCLAHKTVSRSGAHIVSQLCQTYLRLFLSVLWVCDTKYFHLSRWPCLIVTRLDWLFCGMPVDLLPMESRSLINAIYKYGRWESDCLPICYSLQHQFYCSECLSRTAKCWVWIFPPRLLGKWSCI